MTTTEFVKLLRESRLLAEESCAEVEHRGQEASLAAPALAQWCVRQRLLTKFQAQQLLAGRSGPFCYGDFVIQSAAGGEAGWFYARHPQQGDVLLRPVPRKWTDEQLKAYQTQQTLPGVQLHTSAGRRFLVSCPEPSFSPKSAPADSSAVVRPVEPAGNTSVLSRRQGRSAKPSSRWWWTVGTAISLFIGCGAYAAWFMGTRNTAGKVESPGPSTVERPAARASASTSNARLPVPADEQLWARPDPGTPLELPALPAGVQAIVYLRPAALYGHPEGGKVLRSLGPELASAMDAFWHQAGASPDAIERLVVALVPQGTTLPQWLAIAEGDADWAPGDGAMKWQPTESPRRWITGTPALVEEVAAEPGTAALRREMRQLLPATHHTDHVMVLTNANFLRDEAQGLFANGRGRLLTVLDQFWGTEAQAVLLGIQLGEEVMTAELRVVAREDWTPQQLRAHLRREVLAWPSRMTDFLGGIHLDPHWQPLALRFPDMLRFLGEQLRAQCEGRQAAVNVALPVEALHNLLLAGDLALASPQRSEPAAPQVDRSQWTLAEVLDARTSIRIAQKSLEFAAQDIERQVRDELAGLPFTFRIEIVGTDLQPEGITRNQQIRDFSFTDRELKAILTELVRAGNPVPNVAKASDSEQKLVWVPSPDAEGTILITTRSAASRKGYTLPEAFRP